WPRPRNATVAALTASLHGSLAFTGVGHGTGRAVILGLSGLAPDTADPDAMDAIIAAVETEGVVRPPGHPAYRLRPAPDLVYDRTERVPGHTTGLQCRAFDADGTLLLRRICYAIGGGFVVGDSELGRPLPETGPAAPYPFQNAAQMLRMA